MKNTIRALAITTAIVVLPVHAFAWTNASAWPSMPSTTTGMGTTTTTAMVSTTTGMGTTTTSTVVSTTIDTPTTTSSTMESTTSTFETTTSTCTDQTCLECPAQVTAYLMMHEQNSATFAEKMLQYAIPEAFAAAQVDCKNAKPPLSGACTPGTPTNPQPGAPGVKRCTSVDCTVTYTNPPGNPNKPYVAPNSATTQVVTGVTPKVGADIDERCIPAFCQGVCK